MTPADQTNTPGRSEPRKPAPGKPRRDDADLFIAEVTEELQRDRVYKLFRRFGPYAIGAIILLVIGTAVGEFRESSRAESARAAGAVLIEAVEADGAVADAYAPALSELDGGGLMLARLYAAAAHVDAGETAAAATLLREIIADPDTPRRFRDLAEIRLAIAEFDVADPQDLIARLGALAAPDAPYSAIALEMKALAELRAGDRDGARRSLAAAMAQENAPTGVGQRASALLQALGGPLVEDDATPAPDAEATE